MNEKIGSYTARTAFSRGHVELAQLLKAFPDSIAAPDGVRDPAIHPLVADEQQQAGRSPAPSREIELEA